MDQLAQDVDSTCWVVPLITVHLASCDEWHAAPVRYSQSQTWMEIIEKYILVDLQTGECNYMSSGYIHKGLNGQCTDSTTVGLHHATGCHKRVLWWQLVSELM